MNKKLSRILRAAALALDIAQDIIRDNRIRKLEAQVAELQEARIDSRRIDYREQNRESLRREYGAQHLSPESLRADPRFNPYGDPGPATRRAFAAKETTGDWNWLNR